jgi:hypothetical protein
MANEEIKKPAAKEADDLFKGLCLGTLRDDTRLDGNHRRPRWRKDKKTSRKEKTHEHPNSFPSQ